MNKFKIILLGDAGVGKSSLIRKYIYGDFIDNYDLTMGCDFHTQKVSLLNNNTIELQIWDTAGQERFKAMTLSFYRNTHCYILVFDTTDMKSFLNLEYWYNEINKKQTTDYLIVLIGTKKDLKHDRNVSIELIKNFINNINRNIKYFEISSKTEYSLNYIFDYIADILLEKFGSINEGDNYKNKKVIFENNENNIENKYLSLNSDEKVEDKYFSCCF